MHPVSPAGALVGRESEMALLTGLMKEVAQGRGGSVLIEGEPGIGKSALVRTAVAEAPAIGCQMFWGAGDELGQALPLPPFLDGLLVREPSTNPRRETIVRLLPGEVTADCGTDVQTVLVEQLQRISTTAVRCRCPPARCLSATHLKCL
jgi:predicted ATPase